MVHKIANDITQILSCIQEKYSTIGAKVFSPQGAYSENYEPAIDVCRAISLIKLSGNAVFISESSAQTEELVKQVLFRISADKPNNAIQLDMGVLIDSGKGQAGFIFQDIIQYLQASEDKPVLLVTSLGKALKDDGVISVLCEAIEEKSIRILGVVNMEEFRSLEEVPELSGSLQFILAGKKSISGKRKKTVLVIGATSLFGNALYRIFSREYENVRGTGFSKASSLGFDKLDVTSEEEIKTYFAKCPGFDIIIYVAGEANADLAEKERGKAKLLNVDAVSAIARYAKKSKFVYISSEYVFDGNNGPYGSGSKADPINYYGWTKLEGEKISLKSFTDALIIRLGALYGYNGPYDKETSVSKLILSLDKDKPIKADNVQIKRPLLLEDAVMTLLKLLDYGVSGIYQANGPEGLNKQQMAERIAAIKAKLTGKSFAYPITGVEQAGVAAKPFNTHMVNVDTPRPFDEGISYLLSKQQA